MKTRKAFTVLELILAIVFVSIFVVLFFFQKQNIAAMERDEKRKTAINAFYYALEEGYFTENNAYPENIESAEILPWIDPNLFTDPFGFNLWDKDSNYSYEASNCENGKCKSYTLRAEMEKEEAYVKNSRN